MVSYKDYYIELLDVVHELLKKKAEIYTVCGNSTSFCTTSTDGLFTLNIDHDGISVAYDGMTFLNAECYKTFSHDTYNNIDIIGGDLDISTDSTLFYCDLGSIYDMYYSNKSNEILINDVVGKELFGTDLIELDSDEDDAYIKEILFKLNLEFNKSYTYEEFCAFREVARYCIDFPPHTSINIWRDIRKDVDFYDVRKNLIIPSVYKGLL